MCELIANTTFGRLCRPWTYEKPHYVPNSISRVNRYLPWEGKSWNHEPPRASKPTFVRVKNGVTWHLQAALRIRDPAFKVNLQQILKKQDEYILPRIELKTLLLFIYIKKVSISDKISFGYKVEPKTRNGFSWKPSNSASLHTSYKSILYIPNI